MTDDIAKRYRELHDAIRAQTRKLPAVDANGVPLDPARRTGAFTNLFTTTDTIHDVTQED